MLTPEQLRTLRFIHVYLQDHGGSPSYAQIASHLGIRSKSGVTRLVGALVQRGFVRRTAGRARVLEVIRMPKGGKSKPSPWSPISTLPEADDPVWLYCSRTRVLDGPRESTTGDADHFDWWAPCEAPSPYPEGAPA